MSIITSTTFLNFSTTVIGRDREGNDVMADGSIKLKKQVLSTETPQETQTSKNHIVTKIVEQERFDISACVGSPEKLPSIDENMQTDQSVDNILTVTHTSNTTETD